MASEIRNRFTDTEMQIARETDLPELLSHLGYQVKRVGRFHTTAEMDSLRIKDRRKWFRYSQNTGGDAITFLQQFCGKSFPEAVEYLLAFHGRARDSPAKAVPSIKRDEVQKPFALPPRNADDRRVFAYLRKRGIAAQVIRQFLNAGLLYEDAVHHNCVFVGRNESGQAKYAGLRGTYDLDGHGFKGDAPGSDKNTGFSLPHDPRSDLVLVFEAPIDLMSYLTLHRDTTNAVALCGLYDGALQTYLQAHPEIRRIALCLDADKPGQKAARQLQEKYQLQGYAVTSLNRSLMLSIDIIPVPTDEAVREMQNRLLGVETNVTNWQRRQNANNNFSAVVYEVRSSCAEVCVLHNVVTAQILCCIAQHNFAGFEYVAAIRHLECLIGVLLDDKYSNTALVQIMDDLEASVDHDGHQAHRYLVNQQQAGRKSQRAADCKHLLLTA